ncbi:MAG TPA: deoxyguanosinetriphosphate triphosphohydrolase [Clostridiales bacterium UBA8153]|nr:deoxyguanosinetriphosphate triphosphohydrolase [Clostridiales bacterium UBA8153]
MIRERLESLERQRLAGHAAFSQASRGRRRPEPPCPVRTAFQRDRDRIIHSKAFRRLKYKTQVFLFPEGDHFRTRLTHTLEVAQVARTIARALDLNEDLTEAIALGHDLGHTPFGHAGERVLNSLVPGGFRHNEQSLRVVDELERDGGLNLTAEVRDGILNHCGDLTASTWEGRVVHLADRTAYINHDLDDAVRSQILAEDDLPRDCRAVLGVTHSQRIATMVLDIIEHSRDAPWPTLGQEVGEAARRLREFLFERVYVDSPAKREESKAERLLERLYHHYLEAPAGLFGGKGLPAGTDPVRAVTDYLAGMTDRYAVSQYLAAFLPGSRSP